MAHFTHTGSFTNISGAHWKFEGDITFDPTVDEPFWVELTPAFYLLDVTSATISFAQSNVGTGAASAIPPGPFAFTTGTKYRVNGAHGGIMHYTIQGSVVNAGGLLAMQAKSLVGRLAASTFSVTDTSGVVTPALPTGWSAGDLVVIGMGVEKARSGTTTVTITSGWTLASSGTVTSTNPDLYSAVIWRRMQSGDSAPAFTLGSAYDYTRAATLSNLFTDVSDPTDFVLSQQARSGPSGSSTMTITATDAANPAIAFAIALGRPTVGSNFGGGWALTGDAQSGLFGTIKSATYDTFDDTVPNATATSVDNSTAVNAFTFDMVSSGVDILDAGDILPTAGGWHKGRRGFGGPW